MPPSKASARKSILKKNINNDIQEKQNDGFSHQGISGKETSGVEEKILLLTQEKLLYLSSIAIIKKEISDARNSRKDMEFNALQNPEKKEDKFHELAKNVEMWSKTIGMMLIQVTYATEKEREWHLQGSVDDLEFELKVLCSTNILTKKGFVDNFTISSSEPCKSELLPWFSNVSGNIERILKLLKAYAEMNKERQNLLNSCLKKYAPLVTVTVESGEKLIELHNNEVCYFQIKWKLTPSSRHFAKLKNTCRIACTKDGDNYIKRNSDLATIRKQLKQSPIDVIKMLAQGIRNQKKSANADDGVASDTENEER